MHIDRLYSSIWGFVIHIDQQKNQTWNTSSDAAEGCLTSLVFWYDEDNTEQARLAGLGRGTLPLHVSPHKLSN